MDRTSATDVGWTEPPCFTINIQIFHISQLMYRTFPLHRRWPEHPQNQPSTDCNYLSVIGINFPTPTMENELPRLSPVWEDSLTTLLGHDPTSDPGMALRHWVHFEGVHHISDLLNWDQEELKTTPAQQVYSLDDPGQGLFLRTNQIKQIQGS